MKMKLKAIAAAAALALSAGAHAQISGNVVKIGVMNDQSGTYADLSGPGSTQAAKMAIEDFKAKEKGLNVEVVFADHQNKPDVGSQIVRKWYDSDGVDVVVDVPTSSVALAVNQITKDKGKAFLVSGAAASDLTGKACSPNTIHWTYDTWVLANGTARYVTRAGGTTWFFVTADYAFGHALERDAIAAIGRDGGRSLGAVRAPLNTNDFGSYLLQAQASKAKVIGLANAGGDAQTAMKQATEFGIVKGGQRVAGLLMGLTDVHALGLAAAQGLTMTEAFYWDSSDATRAFARRFAPMHRGIHPNAIHAGVYSALLHYFKAVEALKSDADGAGIVARMKATPTDDALFGKGVVRADGRKIHPVYLVEVKAPAESRGPWDYYKLVATIPAEDAFRPLAEGGCPLVR
jgi:branched-chain amino acid transport system substrate-binding protein